MLGYLIARMGFPLYSGPARYEAVDGLRGFLALSVLIHHFAIWLPLAAGERPWMAPEANALNQLGGASVGLFFIITGFVFSPRIQKGITGNNWIEIYIRRVFRIEPLVVFSAICVLAIAAGQTGKSVLDVAPHSMGLWLTALGQPDLLGMPKTGTINANVLWSLLYEWAFYFLIMPGCALGFTLLRRLQPELLIPAMLFIAAFVLGWIDPRVRLVCLFPIGMMTYQLTASQRVTTALRSTLATVGAIACLLALYFGFHETAKGVSDPGLILQSILLTFFFACVASGNGLFGLLKTRAARVLGEVSFSIYVLHGIALFLSFRYLGVASLAPELRVAVLPAIGGAVVLICTITYLLIERPANVFGGRLARAWSNRGSLRSAPLEAELAP